MKAKPWQIAVIVVGLLGAIALGAWSLGRDDGVDIADTYLLIDVESGQIYRVKRNKTFLMLPAPHPETGKVSLIGLAQDEKGYFVTPRDADTIRELGKDVKNNFVDPETGELKGTPKDPVMYRKK